MFAATSRRPVWLRPAALVMVMLVLAPPASARLDTYLVTAESDTVSGLIEVFHQPDQGRPRSLYFDTSGGLLLAAGRRVVGTAPDGAVIDLPLDEVAWVRLSHPSATDVGGLSLRPDALLGRDPWPPAGWITKLALIGGPTLEFDGTAPRTSPGAVGFTFAAADSASFAAPASRVFWVTIDRPEVRFEVDAPPPGILAQVTRRTGDVVDLAPAGGRLDLAAGAVGDLAGHWTAPLDEVAVLRFTAAPDPAPGSRSVADTVAAPAVHDPWRDIRKGKDAKVHLLTGEVVEGRITALTDSTLTVRTGREVVSAEGVAGGGWTDDESDVAVSVRDIEAVYGRDEIARVEYRKPPVWAYVVGLVGIAALVVVIVALASDGWGMGGGSWGGWDWGVH